MRALRHFVLLLLLVLPGTAFASCGLVASAARPWPAAAEPEGVELTFLGHASYLIRTPGGVTAVTDYNGVNIPDFPPDVVTMNHAHSSHYTDHPDPRIRHVLRGWAEGGKPAAIDFRLGDLRIRNIPTNIRDWGGGTEYYGNSIFIFEAGGLCIAHLGHLHHLLTEQDLSDLGRVDVLIAPVDGMWTMRQDDMLAVIGQVHAPITVLTHYFTQSVLQRFLDLAKPRYPERILPTATTVLSPATLPDKPELLVLPGGY